ncbi:MAG: bifunctional UDP-N-acetylglucosamine diphosphorylase/glucosamine-1-phosphate N-acetyltransferase GlmU [Desulfovibrio sp.]|nr:bifunctional UDP-N-acetylglucosamine diphosphorylase/glucosamine-1-phosphate N-acetyltransferase GlmU [Desulfovibrio sp.]
MYESKTAALVLAAGKGTRMHSPRPKVLQEILGEPMLHYVYKALQPLFGQSVRTVVGHGREEVARRFPDQASGFIVQAEQLGTGHALMESFDELERMGCENVFVVNGDTPLMGSAPLEGFLESTTRDMQADVAFMTITLKDPGGFGRVIRTKEGQVRAVVEAKDYDIAEHGPLTGEVNAGLYLLRLAAVKDLLGELTRENNSGEYYITDLVRLGVERGRVVVGYNCGSDPNLMGVNSPKELVQAEFTLRKRIVSRWLDQGVIIHAPESAIIGPEVQLEPGAVLHGPLELYGDSRVAQGAVVQSNTRIENSVIASGALVRAFSHLEEAEVGLDCIVGPYARLRPQAVLRPGARVGNFCEVKKATLGQGAKVNHLTYVGDADVGAGVNLGAGTITCNYDGKNKHRTVIKDGAFIGSNTALVAPVTVGENSLVAAGSVITKDVPDGQLGVARGRQTNMVRRRTRS